MAPEPALERRSHRGRTAALCAIALFIAAGLFGAFGVRSRTVTGTSPGGLTVAVTYAGVARPGLAVPLRMVVARDGGFDAPIEIAVANSYLAALDRNAVDPEPELSSSTGALTVWSFEAPQGPSMTVMVDCRIEPGVQWRSRGSVVVSTGGERVALRLTTWIFP